MSPNNKFALVAVDSVRVVCMVEASKQKGLAAYVAQEIQGAGHPELREKPVPRSDVPSPKGTVLISRATPLCAKQGVEEWIQRMQTPSRLHERVEEPIH